MLPLGTVAPAFELHEVTSQQKRRLQDVRGQKGTVVMFICAHCPYVKHLESNLGRFAAYYQTKGIGFIAISSNDVEQYPEDGPQGLCMQAEKNDFPFPYFLDETQEVARAYDAACTPDFYLFDAELKCVYRGRYDNSSPGKEVPVTGADLAAAIDKLLAAKPIDQDQLPSMGCNIKWR